MGGGEGSGMQPLKSMSREPSEVLPSDAAAAGETRAAAVIIGNRLQDVKLGHSAVRRSVRRASTLPLISLHSFIQSAGPQRHHSPHHSTRVEKEFSRVYFATVFFIAGTYSRDTSSMIWSF